MMVMNRFRKSFDFINLGEWDNLLSNMNMIHTESSIGLIIREKLLIHDRGWRNIKIFAISKLRSVELRIEIILDDLKDRLLVGCYDNLFIVIVSVNGLCDRDLDDDLLLGVVGGLFINDLLLVDWLLINDLSLIDKRLVVNDL